MSDIQIDYFNFLATTMGWQWRLPLILLCGAVAYFFLFGFNKWMDDDDE